MNVHIVALATNAQRFEQVLMVLHEVSHIRMPVVLMGDFNISSILGKKKLVAMMKREGFHVYPKRVVTHRVGIIKHQFDYVFVRDFIIDSQHSLRLKFSDHFPVFVCGRF